MNLQEKCCILLICQNCEKIKSMKKKKEICHENTRKSAHSKLTFNILTEKAQKRISRKFWLIIILKLF